MKPVWEIVGFDQMTYSKLPYPHKQLLMRRAGYPIKIKVEGCEIKPVPRFLDWAVTAYLQEHGYRVQLMGEREAKASWAY